MPSGPLIRPIDAWQSSIARFENGGPSKLTRRPIIKPHVSAITLGVKDLSRAKQFYYEGLGWPIEQQHGDWVSFRASDGQ